MRATAARRLAVAARPVAGDRQHERGDAEGVERDDVEQEPAAEAGHGAGDRATQEGDPEQGEQEDVRGAAEDVERGEDRRLQEHGDEDDSGHDRGVGDVHGSTGVGLLPTRTSTESSDEKSTSERICTCW